MSVDDAAIEDAADASTAGPADFMAAIGGMLTTRSDTFRVRAYGDAVDPLDGTTMQAVTDVVEGWVREYPEQWLWLHRRWR